MEPLGISAGEQLPVTVTEIRPYGVIVRIREGLTCLLHRNEFSAGEGNKELDPMKDFQEGQELQVGGSVGGKAGGEMPGWWVTLIGGLAPAAGVWHCIAEGLEAGS